MTGGYIIRKRITGYAYPRNGNFHNPTPRVCWEVYCGTRLIDSARLLRILRAEYPKAIVERSR
jgi:hypothetical protein